MLFGLSPALMMRKACSMIIDKRGTRMLKFISTTVAIILGVIFMTAVVAGATDRITKEELKELLGKPGVIVLDVRTHGDYDGSTVRIPGAVREDPTDVKSWAKRYSKDSTIVLYCA
jgi:hypothetical protein